MPDDLEAEHPAHGEITRMPRHSLETMYYDVLSLNAELVRQLRDAHARLEIVEEYAMRIASMTAGRKPQR